MDIVPLPTAYIRVPGHRTEKYDGLVLDGPVLVCAYLVRVDGLTVLFDTGLAVNQKADEHYRPQTYDLDVSLAAIGVAAAEVDLIVNCHLHMDHAGGNHRFPGVPILTQRAEVMAAAGAGYTIRAACFDFPDVSLRLLDGEYRLSEHCRLLPLPGHTAGSQGLLLRGSGRRVLLAGQAVDTASEFATGWLARHARLHDRVEVDYPAWIDRLADDGVDRALFAHDSAEWRRPALPERASDRPPVWFEPTSADQQVASTAHAPAGPGATSAVLRWHPLSN